MPNYMDYIKGGEVLVALTLDYKDQYILKCCECEEYYEQLNSFVSHCLGHYQTKTNEVYWSIDELHQYDDNWNENLEKNESITETEEGERLSSVRIETEITSKPSDDISDDDEETDADEDEDGDGEQSDTSHDTSESLKSDDESMPTIGGSTPNSLIHRFMKTKLNVAALIAAYKQQPKLWNSNLPQVGTQERNQLLQEIAHQLKDQINLDLSHAEVAAVITHLRNVYRTKLKYMTSNTQNSSPPKQNIAQSGFMERLNFLRPFMESNSIAKLDSSPSVLSRKHLIQILNIYKRYPNLWNTDLVEYYCENKRNEALVCMIDDIESEVSLNINPDSLKKYIHAINACIAKEKHRDVDNEQTNKKPDYYTYMQFLHDHVGPFKCSECDRSFKSSITFRIHKSQHDGSAPLTCSVCHKEFNTRSTYTAHARRHMGDLKMKCKECDKGFLNTSDLMIHMRCHTGAKPFCCEICGISFRHIQSFSLHKRRHEKRYLHSCPICSKGFLTKGAMDYHVRSHKNIREFSCKTCGKTFIAKKTLVAHEVIHSDDRNHECPLCGKTFKLKIGVSQHMKTHGSKIGDNPTL